MRIRPVQIISAVLLATALTYPGGCMPFPSQKAPLKVSNGLQAEYIVENAAQPAAVAFAPDGRVFYTEKNTGRIRVIVDGALVEQPFAEIPVNYAGERGLLGIAVHPNFEKNGRVYVFYTRSDTDVSTNNAAAVVDNRVVYFTANGNVASGGEFFVASFPAGADTSRVGGRITFAANGALLVALGDLGDQDAAQDAAALPGKVLRYNDDGTIPPSNPTAGSPVFAGGFRDPTGLALDAADGAVYVLDRASGSEGEFDLLVSGGNYGWPTIVGKADTAAENDFRVAHPNYVEPLLVTAAKQGAWVGLSVNPSSRYGPDTLRAPFTSDSGARDVLGIGMTTDRVAATGTWIFARVFPAPITDVAFTPAGTLYVACQNAVLRVVPAR